ncbi:uncharacterized protein LOC141536828 isoform X2 [Cotesia typhae]
MNHTTLKTWLTRGELEKLEHVVLEGRGARLLGEYSPDVKTRAFLRSLPNYLTKISQVHDAVVRGSLEDLQKFLTDEPKKKYAFAKDPSGTPLLIKAVYFGKQNIIEWLIANYPNTVVQKDREGKTALHYCGNCKDPEAIWDLLVEAGCDTSICDKRGRPASYYLQNPQEIELTEPDKMDDHKFSKNEVLDVKPSNIRIWIHNRDIKKLQQVLWEGHGSKLQCEISNNPRVKRFLEAVPYIMVTIKQIHQAVINNDLNTLQDKTAEPVSPVILCAKDSNGLNPLHKAAGLGYIDIATEIVEKYSQAVLAVDNEGKTPLHYAAALRDSGSMYDLLVEYGADESKLDHKQKAAGFYRNRPGDIDLSNLVVIPDAPRTSGTEYPKNWDWRILESQGSLRSKKRSSSDSAIGSAESATKSEENSEMIEEGEKADEPPTEDAPEEAEAEPEEEEEAEPEPEPEAEAEAEAEEEEEEEEPEAEPEPEPEEGEAEEQPEAEENEEEKNEPSTGDSGVEEIPADEDQVIVGEHEELPEVELNDAGMPEDPEVEDLLVNGNMEQLASLVLNGEGSRLLGRQSGNPDLQAFIDNVPSYIGKIHAVHIAAKEGNLRDLQNALDRRKFAIARDNASPHGATALHVAIVFGHTAIIRYLAGRFPETAHAVDVDGRTPLHYAATLADNGHYYNLLLHLGANPLTRDNFEQKAEYYRTNQEDLSHKRLLRDFGAREELADEMLSDKDSSDDFPIFREEDGRYLASSLGTPLIKGLTEVVHRRPKNPVTYLATYLNNFATHTNGNDYSSPKSDVLIISSEETTEEYDLDSGNLDDGYPKSPESSILPESAFMETSRDEHGQSLIHYSAVRTHPKNGFFHLLQERQINIALRDELYRTARDVAEEANFYDNIEEIDRFVVYLSARGETDKLVELLLEGYDHILDTEDDGINILDITAERNRQSTVQFLQTIENYITQRNELHRVIRGGDLESTQKIFQKNGGGSTLFAIGKNTLGRCSLHIAVLGEHVDIVRYIAENYPETLRIGDNMERTALHYAMGVPSVEILTSILIKCGAKRIQKDIKSRQPSYYFMDKTDIQRLQDEEQTMSK